MRIKRPDSQRCECYTKSGVRCKLKKLLTLDGIGYCAVHYKTAKFAPPKPKLDAVEHRLLSQTWTERVLDAIELYFMISYDRANRSEITECRMYNSKKEAIQQLVKRHTMRYTDYLPDGEFLGKDSYTCTMSKHKTPTLQELCAAKYSVSSGYGLMNGTYYLAIMTYGRQCISRIAMSVEAAFDKIIDSFINTPNFADPETKDAIVADINTYAYLKIYYAMHGVYTEQVQQDCNERECITYKWYDIAVVVKRDLERYPSIHTIKIEICDAPQA